MKIIATSDWHLGNLFHGNDRLAEHKHFLQWLLETLQAEQPDGLLIAGDVFDNGNPSASAQSAYYEFLADATQKCPQMQIVITAGNHDSANRLEAPRALLSRHKVEIRGMVHRSWKQAEESELDAKGTQAGEGSRWVNDYDDLIIPMTGADGQTISILAVPYLRSDVVQNSNYSAGVTEFMKELTHRAHELYPGRFTLMMAHMYAKGADIATRDASEKIVIGGQEEVNMEGWTEHPDYLTCGHIHKRQHLWGTDWARYTGSVLPMSFAEIDYQHGVDMLTISDNKQMEIAHLAYTPQHKLRILPQSEEGLSPKKMQRLIQSELPDRIDGKLDDTYEYIVLKVKQDKISNDDIQELETIIATKNVVLCKIQKVIATMDLTTISGGKEIHSLEDILNRDPMETLQEAFVVKHNTPMSEHQQQMLREIVSASTSND
ncbi:MAG: exonuclease subunit SbcD [Paludibacteraceae bacterium]|nr:exonuclease subunit SbcD [Paludibacteraceae bacterium]